MENETNLFALENFRLKIEEVSNDEVYDVKRIKEKSQGKYKQNSHAPKAYNVPRHFSKVHIMCFAEVRGRKNLVCFKNMADWIINDQWYDNKRQNADDEAKRLVETAAIIKNKLKQFLQSNPPASITCSPPITDVKVGWIPDSLF